MIRCPNCGSEYDKTDLVKICERCGEELFINKDIKPQIPYFETPLGNSKTGYKEIRM